MSPKSAKGTMKEKTPYVNYKSGFRDPDDDEIVSDPSYSVFVYQRTGLPKTSAAAREKYVMSGGANTTVGTLLQKRVFVPLEGLKIRLSGTKQQRKTAYMQDWLTFCNWAYNTRSGSSFIGFSATNTGWRNPYSDKKDDLKQFMGGHVMTRDAEGIHSDKSTFEFFGYLLQPKSTDKCEDLPQFIFRR
ncbi:hypothetical protein F4678DRAFT_337018 [Xylaria arbuscula]|nr:hypothetical protein F4678DRAFT_337018 [Xylaria arbuscula]